MKPDRNVVPGRGRTQRYLQTTKSSPAEIDALELVNCLIEDAVLLGASDIHIEPWEHHIVVRIRVHGILVRHATVPLQLMDRLSGRLKVMAELQRFRPVTAQEGHATAAEVYDDVQLRISVFPVKRGEKVVIRIFDTQTRQFRLDALGLDPRLVQDLRALLDCRLGTILFTGPTGSGKTTAIYSSLGYLVERYGESISLATVEDPVEYSLAQVSQAEIVPERDFTYPVALRSLMRQDPQVIMIGEIRDQETARIGIEAGLTGHLVLSTIHSPNSTGVFVRLIHMGIEPFLLASSIVAVLGFRLVQRNCPACSVPYEPEPRLLRMLTPEELSRAYFRRGEGCDQCQQKGHVGRSALSEMIVVDDPLREAIIEKQPDRKLREIAYRHRTSLWRLAKESVLQGAITLEEMLRVLGADPQVLELSRPAEEVSVESDETRTVQ